MSQTTITLAFEQWKALQGATGEAVLLDEFIFASVPGLDPALPIDRSEQLPPSGQIVHRQAVSRKGVVNENAVVHSVVLGADVGDFSFNWIGLVNKATGTLAMIVHAPEQQKLKTSGGQQGNVLTRSFLMEYSGAQEETRIDTPAETWQIDFTARMAGMDERQRLENIDLYGAAAFLADGWLVSKTGDQFFVTKGAGYVSGLRAVLAANQNITITKKPIKVWLDVSWAGSLTSAWAAQSKVTVAESLTDYEQSGVKHYVFALASIDANGVITDLRPKGGLTDQALKEHEKSRNHPDGTLQAKGFVQLSSATDSESEALAATPKAVKAANDNANKRIKTSDMTSSHLDIVAGHVLQVGDYGLGVADGSAPFLSSIYDIKCSGEYNALGDGASTPTTGIPAGSGNTRFAVSVGNVFQNQYLVTLASNVHFYVGFVDTAKKTATWSKFYNTLNKPDADDVGAVPSKLRGVIRDGDTMAAANVTGWWQVAVTDPTTVSDFPKTPGGAALYGYGYMFVWIQGSTWFQHYYNHRGVNAKRQNWAAGPTTGTEWIIEYNSANKPSTASRATNGWFKDDSTGMIFQWGTSNRRDNTTAQAFPIAFPSTCLAVFGSLATYVSDLSNSGNNIHTRLSSNSSFNWDASSTENKIMFFAIGY